MAYPGDPRARPELEECAVTASGSIMQRRERLVGKAVVCSHNGNSHDTDVRDVFAALWEQFGIHHNQVEVMKHFPEQYFIFFSERQDQERVLHRNRVSNRGQLFTFEPWTEQSYGKVARWEFRVRLRLEGVPIHAWEEQVAAKIIGRFCAIHYVEEKTRRQKRTRTYDLWAWSSDPNKIAKVVWLTITDPDRGVEAGVEVHPEEPTGKKHGLSYKVLIHLEVVDDLSVSQVGGGGPGRKRRRFFEWHYGVLDHLGERRERGRPAERKNRHWRRGDDDDFDDYSYRRQRSRSVWDRVSHCKGGMEDCYSSSRFQGRAPRDPTPYRRRQAARPGAAAWGLGAQAANALLVWRPKKRPSGKRVSFADPLVKVFGEERTSEKESKIMELLRAGKNIDRGQPSPAHPGREVAEVRAEAPLLQDSIIHSQEHFDRPLTKGKMEAITILANHGKSRKNSKTKKAMVAVAPVVEIGSGA